MSRASLADWTVDPMRYGMFGWLESILGGLGIVMGFVLLVSFQNPGLGITSLRTAEIVVTILYLLILLFQAVQRWFYKELFAFLYGIIAVVSQVMAVLVAFLHNSTPGSYFLVFFFAWTLAMGVKCFWLCCIDMEGHSRFRLAEHPWLDSKVKIWIPTVVAVLLNFIGFVVQLLILTTTFEEA